MGASATLWLCCKETIIQHFHSEMGASGASAGPGYPLQQKCIGGTGWSLGLCPKLRKQKCVSIFVPLLSLARAKAEGFRLSKIALRGCSALLCSASIESGFS
jgi:hypothetical protein